MIRPQQERPLLSDPTAADPILESQPESRARVAARAQSPTQLTLLTVPEEAHEQAGEEPLAVADGAHSPAPPKPESRVDAPLHAAGEDRPSRIGLRTEALPEADYLRDRAAAADLALPGTPGQAMRLVSSELSGTSVEDISAGADTPADGTRAEPEATTGSAAGSAEDDQAEYQRLSEYISTVRAGQSEFKSALDQLIELAERLGKEQADLVALGLPPSLVSRRYRLCRLRRYCPEAAQLSISRQEELLLLFQPEPELREDAEARRRREQRLAAIPQIVEQILAAGGKRPLSVQDCTALVRRARGHKPAASPRLRAFVKRIGAEDFGLGLEQWERVLIRLDRVPRSQWPIPPQTDGSKGRG